MPTRRLNWMPQDEQRALRFLIHEARDMGISSAVRSVSFVANLSLPDWLAARRVAFQPAHQVGQHLLAIEVVV